jgi:uncharacterized membrane protein
MSSSDPATWRFYGLVVLAIVAIIRRRFDNGLHWEEFRISVAYTAIALILVLINWVGGGAWIITAHSERRTNCNSSQHRRADASETALG